MSSLEQEASNPKTSAARLSQLYQQDPSLGRLLAANPSAPSSLLEEMSHTTDLELLTLAIKNPNASLAVLLRGAEIAPLVFLQNPSVPLLLLEEPGFFRRLSLAALRTMLMAHPSPPALVIEAAYERRGLHEDLSMHSALPSTFLEALGKSSNPRVRERVAAHPNTPPATLMRLLEDLEWYVRQKAAKNPSCPTGHYSLLQRAGSSPNLKEIFAGDESLSAEALLSLSEGGPWAQRLAACHPNTPAAVLTALFEGFDHKAQDEILQKNHSLPEGLLRAFLTQPAERKKKLAGAKLPLSVAKLLSEDESLAVRLALLSNPLAPVEILAAGAVDKGVKIRQRVAMNQSTPPQALRALARDSAVLVRVALAARRDLPREALEILYKDKDEKVRQALSRRG